MRGLVTQSAPDSSCSFAAPTCSISVTRTHSATGRSRVPSMRESGWRVGDHRRELALGGDFTIEHCAAGEFADAGALLNEFDLEPQENARFDRLPELHPVDRHEVNELARPGEAKAL